MAPNFKSYSASNLINLMRQKEDHYKYNLENTTDQNNNRITAVDDLLNQQGHHQHFFQQNDTNKSCNSIINLELVELNASKNLLPNNNSKINLNNFRNKQTNDKSLLNNHENSFLTITQPQSLNFLNHSQSNGHLHVANNNSNHQHHLNLNDLNKSNLKSSSNGIYCTSLIPTYLNNNSKYTGYSTYGKLTHGPQNLPSSNLCINNLHTKTKIYNFKVVILGEMASGKTSYLKKLTLPKISSRNRYSYYKATKGVEAKCKLFEWDDNTLINLEFWDIGGQENYVQMADMFCRDAFGAILMFDVANKQSLDSVLKWKQSLEAAVRLNDNKPIPCVLVANKCDLDIMPWSKAEALEKFCIENNILTFHYVSVRGNINIENVCYSLIKEMLLRYQRKEYKMNNSSLQQKKLKRFHCLNCTIL